jgi:hypothetical protein
MRRCIGTVDEHRLSNESIAYIRPKDFLLGDWFGFV